MHESPVSSALGAKRAKMAGWSDDYSADGSALRSVLRQKEIKLKEKKKRQIKRASRWPNSLIYSHISETFIKIYIMMLT